MQRYVLQGPDAASLAVPTPTRLLRSEPKFLLGRGPRAFALLGYTYGLAIFPSGPLRERVNCNLSGYTTCVTQ